MKQNALAAYQGETAAAYDRYASDRSFAQGVYNDKYARLVEAMNSAAALEQVDYDRNLDNLNYVDGRRAQTLSDAYSAAQMGDFSQLKALGVDTTAYEEQLKTAKELEAAQADLEGKYTQAKIDEINNAISIADKNYKLNEAELYAALNKTDPVDPLEPYMVQAGYVRAMLTLAEDEEEDKPLYENIPSVEEIAAMLASGYTGFDEMLNGGNVEVDTTLTDEQVEAWVTTLNEGITKQYGPEYFAIELTSDGDYKVNSELNEYIAMEVLKSDDLTDAQKQHLLIDEFGVPPAVIEEMLNDKHYK